MTLQSGGDIIAMIDDRFRKPKRMLTNIKWRETSGVDHPANEEEGWLIMKSTDVLGLEEILKEEADKVERLRILYSTLAELDLGDAPQDIRDAAKSLLDWLSSQGYGGQEEYGYAGPESKGESGDAGLLNAIKAKFFRKRSAKDILTDTWPEFMGTLKTMLEAGESAGRVLAAVNIYEANVKKMIKEADMEELSEFFEKVRQELKALLESQADMGKKKGEEDKDEEYGEYGKPKKIKKSDDVISAILDAINLSESGEEASPLVKAISQIKNDIDAHSQVLEKVLERLESLEKATAVRKSLDGQDGDAKPSMDSLVHALLAGKNISLR